MSHVESDQLALVALGEQVMTDDETTHLAACPRCAAELGEMRRAVEIARSTIGEEALEQPPAAVWTRVRDELGFTAPAATAAPSAVSPRRRGESQHPRRREARSRRRIRGVWVLAAGVAIVAAVGAGVWVVADRLAPVPIAQASLTAFPAHPGASGAADVDEARDGSRTLEVTLDADAASDGYREVWLIRGDAAALISLGVLAGDSGSFAIPDDVDLGEYNLVDVSVEPVDGDPAHSGDSIVRGELSPR